MKKKSALILLNGEMLDPRAVRAAARRVDLLICADGGARHAAALRLTPDYVVGDMDSLPRTLLRPQSGITSIHAPRPGSRLQLGITSIHALRSRAGIIFVNDPDQSRSDLDKAFALARRLGVASVLVAGTRGGGLDHELVNTAALEANAAALELRVIDGGVARLLGPGRHRLALKRGARFSLLAAPRARLTLTGAVFGLKDEVLRRGSRGLGNRALGPVTATVREGRVWVIDAARFRG